MNLLTEPQRHLTPPQPWAVKYDLAQSGRGAMALALAPLLMLLATLLLSGAAMAGGAGAGSGLTGSEPSAEFGRCMDRAQAATAAMLDCNAAEWQRQDARLNAAYRQLMGQLPAAKRTALQDAQRLWLRYVDAKCAFLFDEQHFNGSLNRFEAAHCTVIERARRAAELEAIAGQLR